MAPTGPQTRRPPADRTSQQQLDDEDDDGVNTQLFIDPMLGSPLHFYVEKDVPERANLVALISVRIYAFISPSTRFLRRYCVRSLLETWRGSVAGLFWRSIPPWCVLEAISFIALSAYYLTTVDPHNSSGQSLYRLYAGKKGKIVLSYSWIEECIKEGSLQTFHNDWAGCKVDGTE